MSVKHGIILGCPRSGTTFLKRALDTIPEFECLTGTLLPVAIPHVVNQDLDSEVYDALAVGFERAIDAYLHSGRYHSRTAALQKWMRAPTGVSGLFRALRGKRSLPDRFIYKEPALAYAPRFVLDALPEAHIVHLVRDGRDVAHSLVTSYPGFEDEHLQDEYGANVWVGREVGRWYVPWWVEDGQEERFIESSPYVRAIWMWKEMVHRCHEVFSTVDPGTRDQVMIVRYERFMHAPIDVGTAILNHFGAQPTRITQRRFAQAHTNSIGKHQRRNAAEIETAEQIAHKELSLYDYDTSTPSVV